MENTKRNMQTSLTEPFDPTKTKKYVLDILYTKPNILDDDIMPELMHVAAGRKNEENLFTIIRNRNELDWTWLRLFLFLKKGEETRLDPPNNYDIWAAKVKNIVDLDNMLEWLSAFVSVDDEGLSENTAWLWEKLSGEIGLDDDLSNWLRTKEDTYTVKSDALTEELVLAGCSLLLNSHMTSFHKMLLTNAILTCSRQQPELPVTPHEDNNITEGRIILARAARKRRPGPISNWTLEASLSLEDFANSFEGPVNWATVTKDVNARHETTFTVDQARNRYKNMMKKKNFPVVPK